MESCTNDIVLQETLFNELKEINQIFNQEKDGKKIFENPVISKEEKKSLVKKLFSGKANGKIVNFLYLLVDNQRFDILPQIQDQFLSLLNKSKGIVIAEVSSAVELDGEMVEKLKKKLESQFGKVLMESKIEPSLIGGIKVKVNDVVFDGSIKSKLEGLKRRLV